MVVRKPGAGAGDTDSGQDSKHASLARTRGETPVTSPGEREISEALQQREK